MDYWWKWTARSIHQIMDNKSMQNHMEISYRLIWLRKEFKWFKCTRKQNFSSFNLGKITKHHFGYPRTLYFIYITRLLVNTLDSSKECISVNGNCKFSLTEKRNLINFYKWKGKTMYFFWYFYLHKYSTNRNTHTLLLSICK